MCWPICTNQARTVKHKAHGQVLQGSVVHQLVIASLQESGIDAAEGLEAAGRKARGEGHCVLLSNANIKSALWSKALLEDTDSRTSRHGCGNGHNLFVLLALFDECIAEDGGESGQAGLSTASLLGQVELGSCCMQLVRCCLRGSVAASFLGLHVQKDWLLNLALLMVLLQIFQDSGQGVHVVTIDGANVIKAEGLEEFALGTRATA
mmetsp:Transcript_62970/g.117090  ORF Transcript_62970/g.117090 Transcript_62970/m.117090 type:complete len:207 (-) Transcript_62970:1161-1781(-)